MAHGYTPNYQTAKQYIVDVVLPYDGDECLLWPRRRDKDGYGRARVDGRDQLVSRVVCERVYGPPPSQRFQAAHSCGRGRFGCVAKRHLSWKTPASNNNDKFEHGTVCRGASHGCAKLTEEQVVDILALKGKLLQREIADLYGIHQSQVSHIHTGRSWSYLIEEAAA